MIPLNIPLLAPYNDGWAIRSRDELIAPALGDQYFSLARIALDFLPQAVDVGFKRVGGDTGVVTPDIVQQDIAANNLFAGTIQKLDNRRFLLCKAHLLVVIPDQDFGSGLERIRANFERGIFAMLMLAQMGPDAREKYTKAKWLGDVIIGAGIKAKDSVRIRTLPCKHDNGALVTIAPHQFAGFAAIHVGQVHVEDHHICMIGLDRLDTSRCIGDISYNVFFMQGKLSRSVSRKVSSSSTMRIFLVVVIANLSLIMGHWIILE